MPPGRHSSQEIPPIDPAIELALRNILDIKMEPVMEAVVELKTIARLQEQTNAGQIMVNGQTREWMRLHVNEYHMVSPQISKGSEPSSTGKWMKRHPFIGKILYGILYVIGTSIGLWVLTALLPAVATALAHNAHP